MVISTAERARYFEAVNSVVYFALLPFRLNDPSVIKEYAGLETIREETYHRIRVSFANVDDVSDPDNVLMMWIHRDRYTVDYFGYTSGGNCFREMKNVRTVNGIRIADQVNFATTPEDLPIEQVGKLFEEGGLSEVSRIVHENVRVESLE